MSPSPKELIETFGADAREPIVRNLQLWCEQWLAKQRWIEEVEKIIARLPDESGPLSLKGIYQVMLPRVQREQWECARRIRELQECFDLLHGTHTFSPPPKGTVDIAALKERTDIVSVVGQHVRLRKSGARYSGRCPFHADKTPSFAVYPKDGRWWCFACNEGGDVITFTQKIRQCTFREALAELQRL